MAGRGVHFLDAKGPDGIRIYAIGDVHGRLDLLQSMHGLIEADLSGRPADDSRIIHLGDYVDRGPDTKGVIDFLIDATERDSRISGLAGNHDIGFLDFLADPRPDGLFAGNGGSETARSYGVALDFGSMEGLRRTAAALLGAVPAAHLEFLLGLPRSCSFGDFFFCHAGVRPGIALEKQSRDDLIWIRNAFLNHPGLYEKVVVHGHTPAAEAEVMPNRVNVDTGACFTGRLTALVIDGAEKRFLEARL